MLVRHECELGGALKVKPTRLLHQELREAVSLQKVPEEIEVSQARSKISDISLTNVICLFPKDLGSEEGA